MEDERPLNTTRLRALLHEQTEAILKNRGLGHYKAKKKLRRRKAKGQRLALNAMMIAESRGSRVIPSKRGVYVVGCAGHPVKIGVATDMPSRLSAIQTGFPYKLRAYCHVEVPEGRALEIERACHARLSDYRLNGEWFDIDPYEAIDVVKLVIEQHMARAA